MVIKRGGGAFKDNLQLRALRQQPDRKVPQRHRSQQGDLGEGRVLVVAGRNGKVQRDKARTEEATQGRLPGNSWLREAGSGRKNRDRGLRLQEREQTHCKSPETRTRGQSGARAACEGAAAGAWELQSRPDSYAEGGHESSHGITDGEIPDLCRDNIHTFRG